MTSEAGRPVQPDRGETLLSRLITDYGILLALLLLCAYFTWATYSEQHLAGVPAGKQLANQISGYFPGEGTGTVLIVARDTREDAAFARQLEDDLPNDGVRVLGTILGSPGDARRALQRLRDSNQKVDVVAA